MTVGQWLKIAGGLKAECLTGSASRRRLGDDEVALEFGAFVGYSTVRVASLLSQTTKYNGPVIRMASFELDPVHTCIVRHHLNAARVQAAVLMLTGHAADSLRLLTEELGTNGAGFFFMDHRGTRFHVEVQGLEELRHASPGMRGLADNVLEPGAPVYAWHIARRPGTVAWSLCEFLHSEEEDWMVSREA